MNKNEGWPEGGPKRRKNKDPWFASGPGVVKLDDNIETPEVPVQKIKTKEEIIEENKAQKEKWKKQYPGAFED